MLTVERQGEIALLLIKYHLRKRGFVVTRESMRELTNLAKTIQVPVTELKDFARPLIEEVMEECFLSKAGPFEISS